MENRKRTLFFAALALSAVLSFGTLTAVRAEENKQGAETTEPVVTAETAPAVQEGTDTAAAEADAAYKAAKEAYRAAKAQDKLDSLEAELKEMVAAGKLTQEQADLLLNAAKERQEKKSSGKKSKIGKPDSIK